LPLMGRDAVISGFNFTPHLAFVPVISARMSLPSGSVAKYCGNVIE
jgi:hypothetical protein